MNDRYPPKLGTRGETSVCPPLSLTLGVPWGRFQISPTLGHKWPNILELTLNSQQLHKRGAITVSFQKLKDMFKMIESK